MLLAEQLPTHVSPILIQIVLPLSIGILIGMGRRWIAKLIWLLSFLFLATVAMRAYGLIDLIDPVSALSVGFRQTWAFVSESVPRFFPDSLASAGALAAGIACALLVQRRRSAD